MCGICGVIALAGDPVEEKLVIAMRDTLGHRGPDEAGTWLSPDHRVGLGHRRLSIIDLKSGRQPMTNEDGAVWLVFNGEIYNHRELRTTLEAKGHSYRTMCDSESIIHAYEE